MIWSKLWGKICKIFLSATKQLVCDHQAKSRDLQTAINTLYQSSAPNMYKLCVSRDREAL